MARRITAWRAGRRPPPSERRTKGARAPLGRLAATGSPLRAIAWKNVQAEWRGSGVRLPVIIVLGTLAVVWVASLGSAAGTGVQVLATLFLVFAGMAVVLGPYVLRNDLRSDLLLWDLLKSYPLRGADLVAGGCWAPSRSSPAPPGHVCSPRSPRRSRCTSPGSPSPTASQRSWPRESPSPASSSSSP